MGYAQTEIEIRQTEQFIKWFARLKDRKARARIAIRIRRVSLGNLGDVKPVGGGISELRIDYGPGYRIYFTQRGSKLIILLVGGDKTTQASDIQKAKKLALEIEV
jgi:putative addiction module killer protein